MRNNTQTFSAEIALTNDLEMLSLTQSQNTDRANVDFLESADSLVPESNASHQPKAASLHKEEEQHIWMGAEAPDTKSRWWWREIVAIVLSFVSMGVIVAVLANVHNQPTRLWNWSFTPNAVIATCTTFGKMALMIPVVSCISQLKWGHFVGASNPLDHLQRFDDASRGPWGALRFLTISISRKSHVLIAWGLAVVTIAGLAMEPTAQNVLGLVSRESLMTDIPAKAAIATAYTSNTYPEDFVPTVNRTENSYWPTKELIRAQSSTIDAIINGASLVTIICPEPATRCTLPSHSTLGVCSSYRNVTELVTQNTGCLLNKVIKGYLRTAKRNEIEATYANTSVSGAVDDATQGYVHAEELTWIRNKEGANLLVTADNETRYDVKPAVDVGFTGQLHMFHNLKFFSVYLEPPPTVAGWTWHTMCSRPTTWESWRVAWPMPSLGALLRGTLAVADPAAARDGAGGSAPGGDHPTPTVVPNATLPLDSAVVKFLGPTATEVSSCSCLFACNAIVAPGLPDTGNATTAGAAYNIFNSMTNTIHIEQPDPANSSEIINQSMSNQFIVASYWTKKFLDAQNRIGHEEEYDKWKLGVGIAVAPSNHLYHQHGFFLRTAESDLHHRRQHRVHRLLAPRHPRHPQTAPRNPDAAARRTRARRDPHAGPRGQDAGHLPPVHGGAAGVAQGAQGRPQRRLGPRLGADSEVGKAFRLFFTMEQRFLLQFMQAAKAAVTNDGDPYHREPLAAHARQIRQLVLFGNELQREVVAHERPNPQIVESVILVLGKSYLAGDVWQVMSDSDLRDGFEDAVPAIMGTVLAMRPNPNLDADVRGSWEMSSERPVSSIHRLDPTHVAGSQPVSCSLTSLLGQVETERNKDV
ncbi:hypothetical protein PG988_003290 [Apiospora saccharicola]